MNPRIRRLAMMLGILLPGSVMIFLQVSPVLIFAALGLGAVAILFAAGSITPADLKALRRSAPGHPAAEPAGVAKAGTAGPVLQPAGILSQLRQLPGALRDLGGLLHGRRLAASEEESRLDAIDRVLDRTITRPRGTSSPATVRRPVSRGARGGQGGSGGDPFQGLLETGFEPTLLDEETEGIDGTGLDLALDRGIEIPPLIHVPGRGKEEAVKGPGSAAAGRKGAGVPGSAAVSPAAATRAPETPPEDTFDIQFESGEGIPRPLPSLKKTSTPARPTGVAPASLVEVPGTPEARATVNVQEVKPPGKVGDQEMISFAAEPGGSMDDLLAALKADSVRVKRSDDTSLLRDMKGVTVYGKELVDELTTLLKKLRK